MQLLPGTAMTVARANGIPWNGADSLYDPDTNIAIGTAYMRQVLDRYAGQPYFAIAGYNAGPAPMLRWQSQRPGMDPDFWIETISYKETREYVARVLAFSTIYDWRLNGNAAPMRTPASLSEHSCSSGIASTLTRRGQRLSRRLDSTPRSVQPAINVASECDVSVATHASSVEGREKPSREKGSSGAAGESSRSRKGPRGASTTA